MAKKKVSTVDPLVREDQIAPGLIRYVDADGFYMLRKERGLIGIDGLMGREIVVPLADVKGANRTQWVLGVHIEPPQVLETQYRVLIDGPAVVARITERQFNQLLQEVRFGKEMVSYTYIDVIEKGEPGSTYQGYTFYVDEFPDQAAFQQYRDEHKGPERRNAATPQGG